MNNDHLPRLNNGCASNMPSWIRLWSRSTCYRPSRSTPLQGQNGHLPVARFKITSHDNDLLSSFSYDKQIDNSTCPDHFRCILPYRWENSLFDPRRWLNPFFGLEKNYVPHMTLCSNFISIFTIFVTLVSYVGQNDPYVISKVNETFLVIEQMRMHSFCLKAHNILLRF